MKELESMRREPWVDLLSEILRKREQEDYKRIKSVISKGATPHTQVYAYSAILPYLPENFQGSERDALLRIAALAADFTDIPHRSKTSGGLSFGRWAFRIAMTEDKHGHSQSVAPDAPGMIAARLTYLHMQDLEEAARSIRRIFNYAVSLPSLIPPLDYFSLGKTLLRWGNGVSEKSRQVRLSVIEDFYAATSFSDQVSLTSDESDRKNSSTPTREE